jgi:hypothetical protein
MPKRTGLRRGGGESLGDMAGGTSDRVERDLCEVLHESETHVDMHRLTQLCLSGQPMPDSLRADTWRYLLGVSRSEKLEEMSRVKRMAQEYLELERVWALSLDADVIRRVKYDISRYHQTGTEQTRDHSKETSAASRSQMEQVILRYLNYHPREYSCGLLHLLAPFVHVYSTERELYYCFEALLGRIDSRLSDEGCVELMVSFNTIFRHTLPELYRYFEDEAVKPNDWLPSWLRFLLARELPVLSVLRLWDIYLAYEQEQQPQRGPPYFELHPYVCLAILQLSIEDLLELDTFEIHWYLDHLPPMDMGNVLTAARNIREDVISRNLL